MAFLPMVVRIGLVLSDPDPRLGLRVGYVRGRAFRPLALCVSMDRRLWHGVEMHPAVVIFGVIAGEIGGHRARRSAAACHHAATNPSPFTSESSLGGYPVDDGALDLDLLARRAHVRVGPEDDP